MLQNNWIDIDGDPLIQWYFIITPKKIHEIHNFYTLRADMLRCYKIFTQPKSVIK